MKISARDQELQPHRFNTSGFDCRRGSILPCLALPKKKHPALPCPAEEEASCLAVKTRSLSGITKDLKPGSNLP
ncbi:hypothetical protein TNCV_2443451 [Trichonephila clavipes]|nr:hypothetical protein TNCV_2443451 [Trichonephila clavipes]